MQAIVVSEPDKQLILQEVPDPQPQAGEVLVAVAAAGVNRADLLQRAGHYPPPAGASAILGMECSGVITALGPDVTGWAVGDRVCALLSGGGYAEQVAVPATQLLPVPEGVDLRSAAALPEATATVWSNLVLAGHLQAGEWLLVHGGASGIGTMAIQIGRALGARVAVTGSRAAGLAACRDLGAEVTIDYTETDFSAEVMRVTEGHGADVILDIIGAKYLAPNVSALARGGRLLIIGLQGGPRAELDLSTLLTRRLTIIGTTLRSRPVSGPGSKADIIAAVRASVWPMIAAGRVRPVVDRLLTLAQAGEAHDRLEAGGHVGKVVLTTG